MSYFRDRWRAGPIHRYFANLDPVDRATAWIVLALFFAFAVSSAAIARYQAASARFAPTSLTAPPFELRFAALGRDYGGLLEQSRISA